MAETSSFWHTCASVRRVFLAPLTLLLVAVTAVVVFPDSITSPASAARYSFITHTFTPCGATGVSGPTLTDCKTAYSSATWAQDSAQFTVTSGIQNWKVPVTGLYEITAAGARGGGGNASYGRIVRGRITLTEGATLKILVGQAGIVSSANSATGGGGGGSFVVTSANAPVIIGGGGGGAGAAGVVSGAGHGSTGTTGMDGLGTSDAGSGGNDTYGGGGSSFGGGGGGFSFNGASKTYNDPTNNGGKAFANGGTGGAGGTAGGYSGGGHGGFGGGAGSCSCSTGGGGGGGGYSGGGGGGNLPAGYGNGGGGGSYVDAAMSSRSMDQGTNNGVGYITIRVVAPVVTTFSTQTSSPSNVSSLTYDVVFSESVTGLAADDFTVSGTSSGWALTGVAGSGTTYTVSLASSAPTTGTVILTMLANAVAGSSTLQNGPGGNTAAPTMNIDVDPPTASVSSTPSSPAAAMSLTFGISFNESVSGIASGDFSNVGSALGCVFTPSAATGSSVNVVVTQCQEGTLKLRLASGGVSDAAGNAGPVSALESSVVTLAASALSITASSQTVNFGGSWTDSYSQSGLIGSDSVSLTYSYSGTTNDGTSYGPSSTKPTQGGTYSIIPSVSYGVGNTNRYALTASNGSLTINRVAQSPLTVSSTSMTYGQTLSLTTSGGSGNGAVTWDVVSGTCSVSASTLTSGDAGSSCVVKATKAQSVNYTAISSVDTTITIGRASQAPLTVSTTSTSYGNDLVLGTSGGSGTGVVSWQVMSGTCTLNGSLLVPGDAGSACVVKATKAQDTNYLVASSSNTTITISKAPQNGFSISSGSSFTTGSSHSLVASGGQSGGLISWQVTSGICSLTGTTLTASRGGITCTVEASRAGSTNYLATSDSMVITVDKIVQVLTFQSTPPSSPIVGGTYTVSVVSDAALAPTISIANGSASVCSISAGVITFAAVGICTVNAVQAGDDQYAAAAASQQISVGAIPTTTTSTIAPVNNAGNNGGVAPSTTVAQPLSPPTSTTSTTSTTTTSTTVPLIGASGITEVEAGDSTAVVRGKRVKVDVSTVDGQLVLRLPNDVTLRIGPPAGSSSSASINSDGILVVQTRDDVAVDAEGFGAGTTYVVKMYSDPMELGRGEVSSAGAIADIVTIPDKAKPGDHTMVVEGVGTNAEVVSVSVGFTVLERDDNTVAAAIAITLAIGIALLSGRPILRRRRNKLK